MQQSDEQEQHMELEEEHDGDELEDLANKYEELKAKVEQYFDDDNHKSKSKIHVVSVPPKPTKEQWFQHHAIHTPYAPSCKHCVAARAVRHAHPSKRRRVAVVRDVNDSSDSMAKASIDYMFLHERAGQGRADIYNPPHLVMVDHKRGRVWSYRVPNNGIFDGAAWLPKGISQDLDNCGYKGIKLQFKFDQEPAILNFQIATQEIRQKCVPSKQPRWGVRE